MKNVKLIAATFVLAFVMTACSGENNERPQESSSESEQPQESSSYESVAESAAQSETNGDWREFQKTAKIDETVLVDENDIRITAEGIEYTDYSLEIPLLIENNSQKNLSFVSNSIGYSCNSVNGYMIADGYMYCDVAAGKKSNEKISISYDSLRLCGIFEIADIEIGFDISDEDYNEIYRGTGQIKTDLAEQYDYQRPSYRETIISEAAQDYFGYTMSYFSEEELLDQNGIKILSSGLIEDNDGENVLFLEVKNTTEQPIVVTTSNISLNGLGIYSFNWSSATINPGKTEVMDLELAAILDDSFWKTTVRM